MKILDKLSKLDRKLLIIAAIVFEICILSASTLFGVFVGMAIAEDRKNLDVQIHQVLTDPISTLEPLPVVVKIPTSTQVPITSSTSSIQTYALEITPHLETMLDCLNDFTSLVKLFTDAEGTSLIYSPLWIGKVDDSLACLEIESGLIANLDTPSQLNVYRTYIQLAHEEYTQLYSKMMEGIRNIDVGLVSEAIGNFERAGNYFSLADDALDIALEK